VLKVNVKLPIKQIDMVVVLPNPPRNGGVEELHGDPTVGPPSRSGPEVKNRSGAKDGVPERLGCGTVKEEVSQIL